MLRNVRVQPAQAEPGGRADPQPPAAEAVATLTFSKRRIAQDVRKTLESAIANAENNHQLDVDRLVVSRAEVGKSIVMRRFQARGRGTASRVEKWFSHIKIVVTERAQDAAPGKPPRDTDRRKPRSAGVPTAPIPTAPIASGEAA